MADRPFSILLEISFKATKKDEPQSFYKELRDKKQTEQPVNVDNIPGKGQAGFNPLS